MSGVFHSARIFLWEEGMGVAHTRLRAWKDNWNGIVIFLQYPGKVCILSDIQEIDFKIFKAS